ncbi:Nitrilase/cyanide hydratase and apolipoprotein N-acyltransferase [Planctomycetales bacterium 10988]|nr:Nitrilase/cyanide hydratase and apolipoprotein N-acyltransferase [Planctomycetales bacterium 10988]
MKDDATFSLGLVQMRCTNDREENFARAEHGLQDAAERGAEIVCLPELFLSTYPCQHEDYDRFNEAESIPGPISDRLATLAKHLKITIVASLFERRTAGIYHNTSILLCPDGKLAGRYRKMHIPDDPLYYEKFYFTPGDLGFQAFSTPVGKVGMCVCWDQWFPEAARLTAMQGAEMVFYPTAIGWEEEEKGPLGESQHNAWETMMRSHAIANGMFVAAVNRVGKEESIDFWGGSFVSDPYGNVLAKAPHHEETTLVVRCSRPEIEQARRHWPFWRDRRIDAYQQLAHRFGDSNK